MSARAAMLLVLVLLLPGASLDGLAQTPPTRGGWGNGPLPEPNAPEDGLTQWADAPPSDGEARVYFDAVLVQRPVPAGAHALAGEAGAVYEVVAYLGVWRDCDGDGMVGLGALGLLEYPVELLPDPAACPQADASGLWRHNDGATVREMAWLVPRDEARGPGEVPWPGDVRVWADFAGHPDGSGLPTVAPLAPACAGCPLPDLRAPQRAKVSTDLLLRYQGSDAAADPAGMPGTAACAAGRGCRGWSSGPFLLLEPEAGRAPGADAHAAASPAAPAELRAYANVGARPALGESWPFSWGLLYPECSVWACDVTTWSGPVPFETPVHARDVDPAAFLDGGFVPARDDDADGVGDAWAWSYRLLETATDWDLDGAPTVAEFRWATIPIGPLGGTYPNARDFDGDGWLDGEEISYWDANPDDAAAAAAAASGRALRDEDALLDSDGDGMPNHKDPDSDDDGLPDGAEAHAWGTYPEYADSDCAVAAGCVLVGSPGNRHGPHRPGRPGSGDGWPDAEEAASWETRPGTGGARGDCDGDGVPNAMDADSDDDGVPDGLEARPPSGPATDPCDADADDDGLTDGGEAALGSDPLDPDTDDDGMPDGWEAQHGLDPTDARDAHQDVEAPEGDGLANVDEFRLGASPRLSDTDHDWLLDGEERRLGTSPARADTDGDRMDDGWEAHHGLRPLDPSDADEDADADSWGDPDAGALVAWTNFDEFSWATDLSLRLPPSERGTDPRAADTDGDGLPDGAEAAQGSDPRSPLPGREPDRDQDGLTVEQEMRLGTSVARPDTDFDGLCDGGGGARCGGASRAGEALHHGSSPLLADSDADGLDDLREAACFDPAGAGALADADGDGAPPLRDPDSDDDGLPDAQECEPGGTRPDLADTDGDGLPDGDEARTYASLGVDPLRRDADGDGLTDAQEVLEHGTDPSRPDTDGDGLPDADESARGTSPFLADTDRDSMLDGWEAQHGLDPLDARDARQDLDGDGAVFGLQNVEEHRLGTDPRRADTDGDLLPDAWEVLFDLDPLVPALGAESDADGDGLGDAQEFALGTHPREPDTDGDGLGDAWEAGQDLAGLDAGAPRSSPTSVDTDRDGLDDLRELETWRALSPDAWRADFDLDGGVLPALASNLRDPDSDGDGLDDGQEALSFSTRPDLADTDGDGAPDGVEVLLAATDPRDAASRPGAPRAPSNGEADADGDGLSDREERDVTRTDPDRADTDGDLVDDGVERSAWGASDWALDLDGDGLPNLRDPDSDGDGVPDGQELATAGVPRLHAPISSWRHADSDEDGLPDGQEARHPFEAVPLAEARRDAARARGCAPAAAPDPFAPPPACAREGAFGLPLRPRAQSASAAGACEPDPDHKDRDGDLLHDGPELRAWGTSPCDADTDDDGVPDPRERPRDTDRDGLPDGRDADSDGDGLADRDENPHGDGRRHAGLPHLYDADTDDDGLCDDEETLTDPADPDTDGDGLSDGLESRRRDACGPDALGWTDRERRLAGDRRTFQPYAGPYPAAPQASLPLGDGGVILGMDDDADGDGLLDGLEDLDADGVVDLDEPDPENPDTDGDGLADGLEVLVWGKMTYRSFLRHWGDDPARAHRAATYEAGAHLLKTSPRHADTDGDAIPDGSDVNPNGMSPPALTVELQTFAMLDPIDAWAPFCRPELYFIFEVQTAMVKLKAETVAAEDILIEKCGQPFSVSESSQLRLAERVQQERHIIDSMSNGVLRLVLPEVSADYVSGGEGGRSLEWDEIQLIVTAADRDFIEQRSDIIDLDGTDAAQRNLIRSIRLLDLAVPFANPSQPRKSMIIAEGASDGDWKTSFHYAGDDDGFLNGSFSTSLQQFFLGNVRSLMQGRVPAPSTAQSWGG